MKHLLLALCLTGSSTFDIQTTDVGELVSINAEGHTSVIITTEGVFKGIGAIEGQPGEDVAVIKFYDGRRELWLKSSKSFVVLRR